MRSILAATLAAVAIVGAALAALPSEPAGVDLIAYDSHGERYVAGSGDTCAEAWEGAVIPANWTALRCVVRFQ